MRVKRGERRSLIAEVGRWRFRLTLGRFKSGIEYEHGKYVPGARSGLVAGKFFLLTFLQRAPRRAS